MEPDGPIYNSLIQSINHPLSFKDGLNKSSNNYSQAIELIGDSLKNIIERIVDFMVCHDEEKNEYYVQSLSFFSLETVLLGQEKIQPSLFFYKMEIHFLRIISGIVNG